MAKYFIQVLKESPLIVLIHTAVFLIYAAIPQ